MRRSERLIAGCWAITTIAAVALAAVYWRGGQPQLEGLLLGIAFAALAAGFILFAHRLLPTEPIAEERHELDNPPEVDRALARDLERGDLSRRHLLTRGLGVAVGALALAAAFPIRSLGPKPGGSLSHTSWRRGPRAITSDGRLVRIDDVPVGGLVTAYPEGEPGSADGQIVLVRVDQSVLKPKPGRETWSPEGLLAYSKVCTHAGCPVGLYEAQRHQLLCPCHQSAFDVLDAAKPVFGPAAAPLPQLPLAIDADGVITATGDFSDPVGPSFWHHT